MTAPGDVAGRPGAVGRALRAAARGPRRSSRRSWPRRAEPAAITTVRDPAEAVDVHVADSLVALDLPAVRAARRDRRPRRGRRVSGPGARRRAARRARRRWSRASGASARSSPARRASSGSANVEVVNARAEAWPEGLGAHDLVDGAGAGAAARPRRVRGAAARAGRRARRLEGPPRAGGGGRRRAPPRQALGHERRPRRSPVAPFAGGPRSPPLPHLEGESDADRVTRAAREWPANGHSEPRVEGDGVRRRTKRCATPTGVAASLARDGHDLRDRESEGRGRQDDDRRQRRRLHRRGRATRRCSSTSTRRPTRPSGSGSRRTASRASTTSCAARRRPRRRCRRRPSPT